jgi:hypothetical protein
LEANAPVLVSGQVHRRKDEVFVRAKTAFTMRMVDKMSKQVLGVEINLAGENLRTVRLIRKLLNRFKGGDTVIGALNIPAAGIAKWYASGIDGARVFFCPPLYYGLKTILPESSLSLEVTEDMPQELLHALSPSRFPAPEGHSLRPEPEENSAILDAY